VRSAFDLVDNSDFARWGRAPDLVVPSGVGAFEVSEYALTSEQALAALDPTRWGLRPTPAAFSRPMAAMGMWAAEAELAPGIPDDVDSPDDLLSQARTTWDALQRRLDALRPGLSAERRTNLALVATVAALGLAIGMVLGSPWLWLGAGALAGIWLTL
jgi:hypothetical protein